MQMYHSLDLKKAKFKIRTFIIAGMLALAALTIPFYFLLRPLYVLINNPYFIVGFTGLIIFTFTALEIFNHKRLKQITGAFDRGSFIFNLQPLELVYLKTQKLSHVINGVVNELIE